MPRRTPAPPSASADALAAAVALHQAGRHDDAEAGYRALLRSDPSCARAWHYLGLLSLQRGRPAEAVELMQRSLTLDERDPACHSNLGNALKRLDRPGEALAAYRRALELAPDFAEAAYNLGVLCEMSNDLRSATDAFDRAVRAKPQLREAWRRLAACLARGEHPARAQSVLRELAARFPRDPEMLIEAGRCWRALGRTDEAIGTLSRAAELADTDARAARELVALLIETRRYAEARRAVSEALRRAPGDADLMNLQGSALTLAGELSAAERSFRAALEANPGFAPALCNLGNCLKDSGRVEEAVAVFRAALERTPDDLATHSNLLFSLHYSPRRTPAEIRDEHCRYGARFATAGPMARIPRQPGDPLRIGLVSADFNRHPVGEFLKPLFRHAAAAGLSLHAYDCGEIDDAVTGFLRERAAGWTRCASWPDERLVKRIRDDRIDCLIDLAGHTAGNRLPALARRAAPMQATWLGYPGTTGVAAIDWRITDSVADPPGMTESHHTERLLRLARGFLCYEPPDATTPVFGRPPGEPITFGCFNHLPKLRNPELFAVWSRILDAVPDSRLLLKTAGLSDEGVRAALLGELADAGISASRAVLRGRDAKFGDHLRRYGEVDVMLDPFPYNGTTMTCEALWMGVPLVTRAGGSHVSRVGCSLLTHAGLPDWIADCPEGYIAAAVRLARESRGDIESRLALRRRFLASSVCDGEGFARALAAGLIAQSGW